MNVAQGESYHRVQTKYSERQRNIKYSERNTEIRMIITYL